MPHSRRTRFIYLLLLVVLLVAANSALSPHSSVVASPPNYKSPFGIAGAMRWPDWSSFDRPADAVMQTGGAWVREDFAWSLIEPREGQQDWTATDRITRELEKRNLNLLGIISYAVNWATPSHADDATGALSFYPPDLKKYYTFVHTLVARYKGSVQYWEVWNEPNSDLFWKPKPNAAEYAALLKVGYKAIKDADPTATVLNAGMAGNSIPFLEEMVAAGAGNSFDVLAIHPYAIPDNKANGRIESRPDVHKTVEVELYKYQAFLQRHGWKRPIWVTEVGWPANDWQLDAQAQADYLAQGYAQILATGLVEHVFWYSFKDEGAGNGNSWGLTAWGSGLGDLTARRPSFAAYATSAHMLTGTTPKGPLYLGNESLLNDFEAQATWSRTFNQNGELTITNEQHHTGSSSAALHYQLDGPNQAVDFAPPQPIALPGQPNAIGVWIRGDGSGDYLSAWLRDNDGELLKVRFGSVTAAADGWRYYQAGINDYYFPWEHSGGNPANGKVDYPASLVAFRFENTPDQPAGTGTIYLDDLVSSEGPDVDAVRFGRGDGQVVDVLWSGGTAQVSLPTRSSRADVTDRNGVTRAVSASNGALALQVGTAPVYVVHFPADPPQQARTAANLTAPPATSACDAQKRVDAVAGSQYFAETGHNLGGAFLAYWESHDGVRLLGFPIGEEFSGTASNGKSYKQQYFQRARMEYHPENAPPNDVLLGLLGVWASAGRDFTESAWDNDTRAIYFPETGHSVRLFKDWWSSNGGLPVFGYPLSDELQEKSAADGKTYTVQYFERNRLEYHPEYQGTPSEVLLGLLGTEYMSKQGCK